MKVYIAGSSAPSERERIQRWSESLDKAGIEVISTWLESVDRFGEVNPRELSNAERRAIAIGCVAEEVQNADVLWFLVPAQGSKRSLWGELCFAFCKDKRIVSSGDTTQNIFCALGVEFSTDEAAFDFIGRL